MTKRSIQLSHISNRSRLYIYSEWDNQLPWERKAGPCHSKSVSRISLYCIFNSLYDTIFFLFLFIILFLVLKNCIYFRIFTFLIFMLASWIVPPLLVRLVYLGSIYFVVHVQLTIRSVLPLLPLKIVWGIFIFSSFKSHQVPDFFFFFGTGIFITQVPSGKKKKIIFVFVSCTAHDTVGELKTWTEFINLPNLTFPKSTSLFWDVEIWELLYSWKPV